MLLRTISTLTHVTSNDLDTNACNASYLLHRFDDFRQDVGGSVDRLIANRRFGEFGARKMLIAGMNFQGK